MTWLKQFDFQELLQHDEKQTNKNHKAFQEYCNLAELNVNVWALQILNQVIANRPMTCNVSPAKTLISLGIPEHSKGSLRPKTYS